MSLYGSPGRPKNAAQQPLAGKVVGFTATPPGILDAIASVTSDVNGVAVPYYVPIGTGTATVSASCSGVALTGTDTVVVSLATGTTTPPASDTVIPLSANQFRAGSPNRPVGLPLVPGALMPSALSGVAIEVNNAFVPRAVQSLGLHRDGSVKSLLFYFNDAGATVVTVKLTGNTAATIAMPAIDTTTLPLGQQLANQTEGPFPGRCWLPTDPAYLVRTHLTRSLTLHTNAQLRALNADFATWDTYEQSVENSQWGELVNNTFASNTGVSPANYPDTLLYADYYDRAESFYERWLATGTAENFRRACVYMGHGRDYYRQTNGAYTTGPPNNMQLAGTALHYLLTGDPITRAWLVQATEAQGNGFDGFSGGTIGTGEPSNGFGPNGMGARDNYGGEPRIAQRVLMGYRVASSIGDTSYPWTQALTRAMHRVLGYNSAGTAPATVTTALRADGSWRLGVFPTQSVPGTRFGYVQHFMIPLLIMEVLNYLHVTATDDARILPFVRGLVTELWGAYAQRGDAGDTRYSVGYLSATSPETNPNPNGDGPYPTYDLDNIYPGAIWGFAALCTDPTERALWLGRGNTMFANAIPNMPPYAPGGYRKQFEEETTFIRRGAAYRALAVAAGTTAGAALTFPRV